jgi:hypothetical protein
VPPFRRSAAAVRGAPAGRLASTVRSTERAVVPASASKRGTLFTDRTFSQNMSDSRTNRRPWLAAVLGLAVTGFGHLYLRRWGRALGWVGVVAVTTLFVPRAAVDAVVAGGAVDVVALAPVLFTTTLSALDAYVVASRDRAAAEDATADRCPNCRGELRADLAFCPWCARDLDAARTGDGGGSR